MILLDLDPNIVKPGWTPFLITIGLAAVMYLLFRSMRRQFRRVHDNFDVEGEDHAGPGAGDQPGTAAPDTAQPGREVASAAPPVEGSPPRP